MRRDFTIMLGFFLFASSRVCSNHDFESIKSEISHYQNLIHENAGEKSALLVKLSGLYLKDQDLEKAIWTYLEALKELNCLADEGVEDPIYQQALDLYLDHSKGNAQVISEKIISEYAPKLEKHPDSYLLGYIVAFAYANLGKFENFFKLFYNSYQHAPNHYLAHKALSILHVKLFEKSKTPEERDFQREAIVEHLGLAIQKYPNDDTLYKLSIAFSKEEQKLNMIRSALNKIIDSHIILSRTDIPFYVAQAVEAKDFALAQRFIDKMRSIYQKSRVIDNAQEYLNKHKEKH